MSLSMWPFIFPRFSVPYRYKIIYYAPVKEIRSVRRADLFPREEKNAGNAYLQIMLGEIKTLPKILSSPDWRRIVHIPSTLEKLFNAESINDLYDTSTLEDKLYRELKHQGITAFRQIPVSVRKVTYVLDFGDILPAWQY